MPACAGARQRNESAEKIGDLEVGNGAKKLLAGDLNRIENGCLIEESEGPENRTAHQMGQKVKSQIDEIMGLLLNEFCF